MVICIPGYSSQEKKDIVEENKKELVIPENHWFLDEHNYNSKNEKIKNHNIDPYGIHHKTCNVKKNITDNSICSGNTYCFVCYTPCHECTDNICYNVGDILIKCHSFCYKEEL